MLYLVLGVACLLTIILVSLRIEKLLWKVLAFVVLAAGSCLLLASTGHATVVAKEFGENYAQFIPIPLLSVFIAALLLFEVKVGGEKTAEEAEEQGEQTGPGNRNVGWFLLIACPIAGNFATTWALVPILYSLYHVIHRLYPKEWERILVIAAIFGMNLTALATLLADPPQALWAILEAKKGNELSFFAPAESFWFYLLVTWVLYGVALCTAGVRFGSPLNLFAVLPTHLPRCIYGIAVVAAMAFAITRLEGYQITLFLGGVCVVVAATSPLFGKEAVHHTLHWGLETVAIFLGFFAVVCFAHVGLHDSHLPRAAMVPAVVAMTAFADNAAAFLTAYPVFESLPPAYQTWFNLFPSVVFGGSTPLGNGPQITLFLVILCGKKAMNPARVFTVWFQEVWVFVPYILVWTVGMVSLIEAGEEPTLAAQLPVALVATMSTAAAMLGRWWVRTGRVTSETVTTHS